MSKCIVHADMDAFYAAVEQRDRPELRDKPVIVGGTGPRGVVSTASYEARVFGVHSAMPSARARMLCPDGIFVPPRMKAYLEASRRVFEVFEALTPEVEALSLDEAFLDVTASRALFGDGPKIARRIKREVHESTGLRISAGVATSKFVAKVASDLDKPDGLVVVPVGGEREFLAPLPVSRLWGAGRVTIEKLERHGLKTIADVQRVPEKVLCQWLGPRSGRHFHRLANAKDSRAVESRRSARSVSAETTFPTDMHADDDCREVLLHLSERVGRRLRKQQLLASTVKLKLRYGDFTTLVRQVKVGRPTADDMAIFDMVASMFDNTRDRGKGVRLLGVGTAEFSSADEPVQLGLFDDPTEQKADRLMDAMDRIRDRFGEESIEHGKRVRRRSGFDEGLGFGPLGEG